MLKAKIKLIEDGKDPVKGSEKASCYVGFEIVDELSETKRGENGFGSTGK